MANLRRRRRGVLLFHDSKTVTVRTLPQILDRLATEGDRLVHLKTKSSYRADPDLVARYRRQLDGTPARAAERCELVERRCRTDAVGRRTRRQRDGQPSPVDDETTIGWPRSAFVRDR
ncbi:MAG: hypothetical protein AAGB04_17475 [Pseudomonadota bacterium]